MILSLLKEVTEDNDLLFAAHRPTVTSFNNSRLVEGSDCNIKLWQFDDECSNE